MKRGDLLQFAEAATAQVERRDCQGCLARQREGLRACESCFSGGLKAAFSGILLKFGSKKNFWRERVRGINSGIHSCMNYLFDRASSVLPNKIDYTRFIRVLIGGGA